MADEKKVIQGEDIILLVDNKTTLHATTHNLKVDLELKELRTKDTNGKEQSPCEVINDTNKELVNFYRVAQTDYDALKREVDASLHSRDQHTHAKHIMTHPQFFTPAQRVFLPPGGWFFI
mgnify:CR=1 FL=1